MLLAKTVCPAGSLIYIVPTGLQVTVHYDARGNLMKVYQGFENKIDLGEDFMKALVRMHLIPSGIRMTGGITDFWGVFYSDKFTSECGILPECEYDRIKADIISGTPGYKLYVGNVITGSATIMDPASMESCAQMCGFSILPSWLLPSDFNDNALMEYMNVSRNVPFKFPHIAGFISYVSGQPAYYTSTNIRTAKVDKVKKVTDLDGYIRYEVTYGNKFGELRLDYPMAVNFNILKDSQLILDRHNILWCSTKASNTANRLAKRITCSHCGKILDVPEFGDMQCTDPFCTSRLYPKISHFCRVLGIESLSSTQVSKYIKSEDLQTLSDLLILPKFKELKIEKPLTDIIYAIVPSEVGLNKDWLSKLCDKCSNQYKTVKYYFDGPRRITTELDMEVPLRFNKWLSDPRNLLEMDTIINSEQIIISNGNKLTSFDAPPILRDKTIFITGTFLSGSTNDIITILQSYGATVVTDFDEYIQYVVVGDIKDGINGGAILGAKALGIPVVEESEFFAHYGIDADIEQYLK